MTTSARLATKLSIDHRCDTDDKRVSGKFDSVKAKLRQSPLLRMIREAHEGPDNQSSSTDNATPFTMNGSFFLGEDEGQRDEEERGEEERYSPQSEEGEGTSSSRSDDGDSNDSQQSDSDSHRSFNSEASESYYSDSDAPF